YDRGTLTGERPGPVNMSPPKQQTHGDYACAAALPLAKAAKRSPREIAAALAEALGDGGGMLAKTEIAGPGFLNLFLSDDFWRGILAEVLAAGPEFIRSEAGGGRRVLVEFVSANPTGPLHIAHGRGAVTGDILARILEAAGYTVGREYYVNDLGRQVEILGESVYLRYGELHGRAFSLPEDFYPGEYVTEIARELVAVHGDRLLDAPRDEWLPRCRDFGVTSMLRRIRADLEAFGITIDRFVSERELTHEVGLARTLDQLEARGHIFQAEGKRWFRSTAFGDDKDRVVAREDGTTTYFASDIAYHHHKFRRGFERVIDIWGADHHGYVPRIMAATEAMGFGRERLRVILIQLVNLLREGQPVAMSTRAGEFETLRDVMTEVGKDAARFMFLTRRSDAPLDFDLELAKRQGTENPVYYVQYAHARLCSVFRTAAERGVSQDPEADLGRLHLPEELALIKRLAVWPDVVEAAAFYLEPHRVSYYLTDLAATFHAYYNRHRILSEDTATTQTRLLLAAALKSVFANALALLSVNVPESM
ncbi:MAG: arginine--tRNA ligase, partial [Pseudomonadota bacterium]